MPRYFRLILFAFAVLLYANTVGHEYTQDDAIVIYDNMYTQQGIAGIPGLLTKDTFHGFFKVDGKEKLVSGGRYRPLTPILFAIEYQIFGAQPWIGHLINALLYGCLCVLLFLVLSLLFKESNNSPWLLYVSAAAALLFAAHPIHTEAVANIKGRDEIMALLLSLVALYMTLRYVDDRQRKHLIGAAVAMFTGLLSKENTITFLAVIPFSIYLFRQVRMKEMVKPMLALMLATVAFLILRTSVLGMDFGGDSMELMNNPFLKIEGGRYVPFETGEWFATIMYTLGKYLQLLVWPHPLTHDYYPRHVEIMQMTDISVLLSIGLYILIAFVALSGKKFSSIIAWCAGLYLATLSIVSNLVFPIGTNMSERFLFMPSVGFAVLTAYLIYRYVYPKSSKVAMAIVGLLLIGYSAKTISRNQVWQDDFTLFTTDVKTSGRSAKVLNAAGGALSTKAANMQESADRTKMLDQAAVYLKRAQVIHPNYANASLLLGNVENFRGNYDQAIIAYNKALSLKPDFPDALKNLAITYRDAGRQAGEVEGDLPRAIKYLKESIKLDDQDMETIRLLGVASAISGDHRSAVYYFEQVLEQQPDNQAMIKNLMESHQRLGNQGEAAAMAARLKK